MRQALPLLPGRSLPYVSLVFCHRRRGPLTPSSQSSTRITASSFTGLLWPSSSSRCSRFSSPCSKPYSELTGTCLTVPPARPSAARVLCCMTKSELRWSLARHDPSWRIGSRHVQESQQRHLPDWFIRSNVESRRLMTMYDMKCIMFSFVYYFVEQIVHDHRRL